MRSKSWEKTPGSPVCAADLEVDAFLKRELRALLPSAGWLSRGDRSTIPNGSSGACAGWSTRSTARAISSAGARGWAVSVALVSAGAPADRHARSARRAARAGARLRGRAPGATASGCRRAGGASCPGRGSRPTTCRSRTSDLTMVDKPNSIALAHRHGRGRRGRLVATLRWGFEWDVAAAALIAREAGAAVTRRLRPAARLQQARSARLRPAGQRAGDSRRRGGTAGRARGGVFPIGHARRAGPAKDRPLTSLAGCGPYWPRCGLYFGLGERDRP